MDAEIQSQLRSLHLKNGEIGAEAVCVAAGEASDQPVALGVYTLKWKRYSSSRNVILVHTIHFLFASQSANTYAPGLTTLLPCGHSYL